MSENGKPKRKLYEIANEIEEKWQPKVNFAARPYLTAMKSLGSVTDNFHADDGRSICLYFLSNASSFRGADARRLKAELKGLMA